MNKSVKGKMGAIGAAVALTPSMITLGQACIQSKSVQPIINNFGSTDQIVAFAKTAITGYAFGYAIGIVCDKTGLKKGINKATRRLF